MITYQASMDKHLKHDVGECALVLSIYPLRKAICLLCQVETSVVWFFPFKRTWSPSFDTLNLFGDFLGGGLNSIFLIKKLLGLILEHFFKFKNLSALFKNQVLFHVHTTNSLTLMIVWVQKFRINLF
jgi:hypothetical protein